MAAQKSAVFVASSTEGEAVAEAIAAGLERDFSVVRWQDWFRPGNITLPRLYEACSEVDFAVVVFSHDDYTKSRGRVFPSPRDNVVLELGLFYAALGLSRVFVVAPRATSQNANMKIPSDIYGVTPAKYDADAPDVTGAVRSAVDTIRKAMRGQGRVPRGLSIVRKPPIAVMGSGYWFEVNLANRDYYRMPLGPLTTPQGSLSVWARVTRSAEGLARQGDNAYLWGAADVDTVAGQMKHGIAMGHVGFDVPEEEWRVTVIAPGSWESVSVVGATGVDGPVCFTFRWRRSSLKRPTEVAFSLHGPKRLLAATTKVIPTWPDLAAECLVVGRLTDQSDGWFANDQMSSFAMFDRWLEEDELTEWVKHSTPPE